MEESALSLPRAVAGYMKKHGILAPGDTVLAAVSGGADSVALLLVLAALQDTLQFTLHAAHFEHGIRGEASLEDMAFVAALCEREGIPCHVGRGDVPRLKEEWKVSLEDAARRARYAFLEETAARLGGAKIALAHQLEDQAETLLLHLAHGCGLQGLAAMRPVKGNRIRPLLATPRCAVEAFLRARGMAWREDATNRDRAHARNLLRHEVFPVLRRLNPRVSEAMARTASLAAEAADRLAEMADRQLDGRVKRMPYGAFWQPGDMRPEADAIRAFLRYAKAPEIDAASTRRLAALAPSGVENLPAGWRVLRTRERFHAIRPEERAFDVRAEDFVCVTCAVDDLGDGRLEQTFDADRLEGAVFRARRPGDVFAPLGAAGTQKLKKTLQDAGIDQPFRDLLPVIARGNRVLWIVGLKPSRDAAVTGETRRAVKIRYRGELPWTIQTIVGGKEHDKP